MTKTASNIWVGAPSTVLVAAYGVAEGSAVDLGSSEGGLKIIYSPEFYFKKADQWLGKVGAVKTDEDMTIEITLAECTLANVAYAFGYPTTAVSSTTFTMGGDSTVTERTLYINGNAPGGGSSKMTVHKCVLINATEINMVKNDKTMIKCTFQVLQDTSQTDNQEMISVAFSGTDTTAPTVAITSPAEDATIAKDGKTTVTFTFTESDNEMDQGSLIYGDADNTSIRILNLTDTTAVVLTAGSITYASATKVVTFTPTSNWTGSDKHVLVVDTKCRDTAGNHLASTYFGHFTVAA